MVRIWYITRSGHDKNVWVPDARLELEIRNMFQARIRCEAFNEIDDLVGAVADGADESGRECLVWWCDPEPNAQEAVDARER